MCLNFKVKHYSGSGYHSLVAVTKQFVLFAAPIIGLHGTALILQIKGSGGPSTTSLNDMSHADYLIEELLSYKGEEGWARTSCSVRQVPAYCSYGFIWADIIEP